MDIIAANQNLSTPQRAARVNLKSDFELLSDKMDIFCGQKSRTQWDKDGDRNTKFFHRITKVRRRKNNISSLKINGNFTEDKSEIKEGITSFFKNLLKQDVRQRPSIANMEFNSISDLEAHTLEAPLTEEECIAALKALGQDRAPGPDGFQVMIIGKCWSFMRQDIMGVVRDFNKWGTMNWRLKTTLLSLLPKKNVVEEIKDFRPISLMGSIYKMISKVLAGKLKLVHPKIISCHQSAFIKGRQILDCALLANECMNSRIKSGTPGIIVKVDFEKAFDHVSWGFLDEVLSKMGFGRKWRTWIQGCISNIPISVLINGSPHQQFTTGHLQFADDTLVFLDESREQVDFLRHDYLPANYLGLSLGDSALGLRKWDALLEKVKGRLPSWIRSVLNKSGKLTLVKSVLSSIPVYMFSLFTAPVRVINKLEKVMSDFLWDKSDTVKCYHPVKWKKVRTPLSKGGLGIKSLRSMNKALICKWWWRFNSEKKLFGEEEWSPSTVPRVLIGKLKLQNRRKGVEYGKTFTSIFRSSNQVPLSRNTLVFENINFNVTEVIKQVKIQAYCWVRNDEVMKGINLDSIITNWSTLVLNVIIVPVFLGFVESLFLLPLLGCQFVALELVFLLLIGL
ncbi:uncharacterized protein LOC113324163 [Papaver somniferum]|uniref:uncharacterized protein LOC113324163 n=1 Tax=Papaver somniferum TaxID=3469 RepID=UPI000E6FF459|nr:uncharacterized protein LOC113324163 [Papaver somniferum]